MKTRALASGISILAPWRSAPRAAPDDTSTTTEIGHQGWSKGGKLTICTHLPYEPFQYTEGGKIVGFDVDVIKIAADANDLETKVIDISLETIESGEALNTGKCDVAAAGMTITDEREKVMDFSDPYFDATQALLARRARASRSLDELAGKTVGVQDATTGEDYVEEERPRRHRRSCPSRTSRCWSRRSRPARSTPASTTTALLHYYVSQNPRRRGHHRVPHR